MSSPAGGSSAGLSDDDFRRIATLVRTRYGIRLTDSKRIMVDLRLRKRIAATRLGSHHEYLEYVMSQTGMQTELQHMVDVITTNKTDFYREPKHFDLLTSRVLPDLYTRGHGDPRRSGPLAAWSAASSTGEEAYTVAITLDRFARSVSEYAYSVVGTDLSSQVVSAARNAIYDVARIEPVPDEEKRRYFRRGTKGYEGMVRVVPELRSRVSFHNLNLLDVEPGMIGPFDVVFLRNVIIYFDRPARTDVVTRVVSTIRPGGFLFVGHSETLFDLNLPLAPVAPTVYQRLGREVEA